MKVEDIIKALENIAPIKFAEEWDNVGLLIGSRKIEVKSILVTLDITPDVVEEAIQKDVNLVISHHPLFIKPFLNLTEDDHLGKMIIELIRNKISVYCSHTNFDSAPGGLNDILFNLIGYKDSYILSSEAKIYEGANYGIGRMLNLSDEITIDELISKLKYALKIEHIISTGNIHKKISKVALCTGSGGSLVQECINKEIDVFVTGEIKYHEAQLAIENGVDIISLGHYESEFIFVDFVIDYLNEYFSVEKLKIHKTEANKSIFNITRQ